MKTLLSSRWMVRLTVAILLGSSISCMTTYDRQGRPMPSVDPGVAVAGVAAAGILGYALANDHRHHRGPRHYRPARGYHCR